MSRALLSSLAADPNLAEGSALAYERLHALEVRIAEDTEAKYLKARKKTRGIWLSR